MRRTLVPLAILLVGFAEPHMGDPAPRIAAPDLGGGIVQGPRAGEITVVEFSATWCGSCRQALPAVESVLKEFEGRAVLMVVDVGEEPALVRRQLERLGLAKGAQVALDLDGQVSARWGQHRLPTTFVIDARGIIRHINRGYGAGYAARLRRWLHGLTDR